MDKELAERLNRVTEITGVASLDSGIEEALRYATWVVDIQQEQIAGPVLLFAPKKPGNIGASFKVAQDEVPSEEEAHNLPPLLSVMPLALEERLISKAIEFCVKRGDSDWYIILTEGWKAVVEPRDGQTIEEAHEAFERRVREHGGEISNLPLDDRQEVATLLIGERDGSRELLMANIDDTPQGRFTGFWESVVNDNVSRRKLNGRMVETLNNGPTW